MRALLFLLIAAICFTHTISAQSFELRYFTNDPKANGATDYKGPTAYFSTEERVDYLRQYAKYAKSFYQDTALNTVVVRDEEAAEAVNNIKPQPLPSVRRRISLNDWQYIGYREGQYQEKQQQLKRWENKEGVRLQDGHLLISQPQTIQWKLTPQSWRSTLRWRARWPENGQPFRFALTDDEGNAAAIIGADTTGSMYYLSAGDTVFMPTKPQAGEWHDFRLEIDLAAFKRKDDVQRYNLYVDDTLMADYVPIVRVVFGGVGYAQNFSSLAQITKFTVKGSRGLELDDIWGVGYHPTGRESYPYTVATFVDENFAPKPALGGWKQMDYTDTAWQQGSLPIVHGSERHSQEDLYLRKKVFVPAYQKARLVIETLDPGGEVWVNGRIIAAVHDRHPQQLDLTKHLIPNDTNLIAVKVNHFFLTEKEGELMPHSSLDINIGWFAGRMHLDLTGRTTVEDVFVHTEKLEDGQATLQARILIDHQGYLSFRGKATINAYPWFPEESSEPIASATFPVVIGHGEQSMERTFTISNPQLWTPEDPHLYRIEVVLEDDEVGEAVDDAVITSGIRTLSQKNGTFHLNGKPAMLNGAQIMGFRGPIENLATWVRCAPVEWLAKEIMMVKRMNGNLIRVHVHAWEFPSGNINDPRLAEMADQMGMMMIWGTPAWIRTGWGWGQIDFAGLPQYMKQVYNHPSIVIWEGANHTQSFKERDVQESNLFCEKVYETIYPVDPSRIISFNSYVRHLHYGNDEGTVDQEGNPITPSYAWTAPMVTRGNQDGIVGYSRDWSLLRTWPDDYIKSFLDSKERAYFNFEHEESMGQPNWNLVKGKPWYHLHSYEWEYDEGTIGRRLTLDEWEESQAWQAFSAWESMKKQRWLDYDGFSWCCLHGGANSGTYKKPIIDMTGHAKLAYWANKMIFQPTVAGAKDVDVVYGPDDTIVPVIMHLGNEENVRLKIEVTDGEGNLIASKVYDDINLKEGRNTVELTRWKPEFEKEGFYVVNYTLN